MHGWTLTLHPFDLNVYFYHVGRAQPVCAVCLHENFCQSSENRENFELGCIQFNPIANSRPGLYRITAEHSNVQILFRTRKAYGLKCSFTQQGKFVYSANPMSISLTLIWFASKEIKLSPWNSIIINLLSHSWLFGNLPYRLVSNEWPMMWWVKRAWNQFQVENEYEEH